MKNHVYIVKAEMVIRVPDDILYAQGYIDTVLDELVGIDVLEIKRTYTDMQNMSAEEFKQGHAG